MHHFDMCLQIERSEDYYKDKEKRGGDDRQGDLNRPIKNRKIDWIFTHWWCNDLPYVFEKHTDITMTLTRKQVQTLAPANELEDDVVNAYMELVRLRERYMRQSGDLHSKAKRFFIAPSFLMYQSQTICKDLNVLTSNTYFSLITNVYYFLNCVITDVYFTDGSIQEDRSGAC